MALAGQVVRASDLLRPRAKLRQTVAQAITTATWTAVLLDTEDVDEDNGHDTVSNTSRYVFTRTGWFWVAANAALVADAAAIQAMRLIVNSVDPGGIVPGSQVSRGGTASVAFAHSTSGLVQAAATTDYVELQVFHNKGSNLNTSVAGSAASQMSILFAGP
jgi:hypothetical protein